MYLARTVNEDRPLRFEKHAMNYLWWSRVGPVLVPGEIEVGHLVPRASQLSVPGLEKEGHWEQG